MTEIRFPKSSIFLSLIVLILLSIAPLSAISQTQTCGLFLNDSASYEGYTIFVAGWSVYMIDNYGRQVHRWDLPYSPGIPGLSNYLLDDGTLLWASNPNAVGQSGAHILKTDWDGNTVWEWKDTTSGYLQHHDIAPMPNGNVLVLARDFKQIPEIVQAGRDTTGHLYDSLWSEMIFEVKPTGPTSGDVVWVWYVWDHLVQDFDSTVDNYGVIEDHPELMDININDGPADWLHSNGIAYNAELDQIVMSHRTISEIWVIDHSTTTAEAAGHTGGNSGMGGDIIYRWGNPIVYKGGDSTARTLFKQHNPQWIDPGYPGEGNILVYNNGNDRGYSSVDEIQTPVDSNGNYPMPTPGHFHEPIAATWTYVADPPDSMYSGFISGAERLLNGNTLICEGASGDFREVDSIGNVVWRYIKPINSGGPIVQGEPVFGNATFRTVRYPLDHPAFAGKNLTPGGAIEIYSVDIETTTHRPKNPAPFDASFTVTTIISTDSGISSVELYVDTGAGFSVYTMYDDGVHGDGSSGDGIYGTQAVTSKDTLKFTSYYVKVIDGNAQTVNDPPNPTATVYRVKTFIFCGDINGITAANITDILDLNYLVNYLFRQGPEPPSLAAANVNGITGAGPVDILDLTYVVNYLFRFGPAPVCE